MAVLLLLGVTTTTTAFMIQAPALTNKVTCLQGAAETVEVCGFKDCKRSGGGPRLEKLVNAIVEEKDLVDTIKVEGCDCQVCECNYLFEM
jgi:hypothetical protein